MGSLSTAGDMGSLPDTRNLTSLSDTQWTIDNAEHALAHLTVAISVIAVFLNLGLLRSTFLRRSVLVYGSSIGLSIALLCIVSTLYAVEMAVLNEIWVLTDVAHDVNNTFGPLDADGVGKTLAVLQYVILTSIFTLNFMLALARYWTLKYNKQQLPAKVLWGLAGAGGINCCVCLAAFVLPHDGIQWNFLPIARPCSFDDSGCSSTSSQAASILLLIGLSYFLLTSCIIAILYENSYFVIASVMESQHDTSSRKGRKQAVASIRVHRGVLLRCIVMSVGIVLFYIPDIILVALSVINPALLEDMSDAGIAVVTSAASLVPSLDPLWTPLLVVLCQEEFRRAVIQDYFWWWRRTSVDEECVTTQGNGYSSA